MANECSKCHTENTSDSQFCKKCATPLPQKEEVIHTKTLETPKKELKRGSVFAGRYEIIEEIGKGGMGHVYRVEDTKAKEEVALKLIRPDIATDKKTIERFQNELTTARKIVQKNVCRMYDIGGEKGQHYITMEYVSGGDLKKFIRRSKQLSTGTAISIAKQICDGLEEAHNIGIVHRDLKPNNIMIDDNGNARIMDFGIARTLKEKGITGPGVMIGTPEYMSPEQVEAKEVDQCSDIYSLGIIMYEMLTGRLPFEADTPFAVGMKQKSEIPKDPKELNPQIPDDLSNVILRCLEKEKEKRYQSASEVRSELEKIEQGLPTTDRVISKKKTLISREITVQFSMRKVFVPASIILAIVAVGMIIWSPWKHKEQTPIPSDKPSIAILPFDDLSPDKDQEYLCDGLAEAVINALNKVRGLRIPAKMSSFVFRDREKNIKEIGDLLDVGTILEGSLQKIGNKIRVMVRLINVPDESLLWSEDYDREFEDLLAIQDDISLAIVDNLRVRLFEGDKEKILKRYTENIEAYNLYLRGRFFWNKRTEEDIKKANEYFDQALKIDTSYALGYVGKADAFSILASYDFIPPKDAYLKAKEAALKALEIDETLAEAHASLAHTRMNFDLDWKKAETAYKRAIELNPNYATAFHWYAFYFMFMARVDESIDTMNRALELDPLSLIMNTDLGRIYYWAGQYDRAKKQIEKALELDSGFWKAHLILGQVYIQEGKYEEAVTKFQHAQSLSYFNQTLAYLGCAYGLSGRKADALNISNELLTRSQKSYVPPFHLALIHASLGDKNEALHFLEMGYEERDHWLRQLLIEPMLDSLRSETRFVALLKKMNLDQ